MGTPAAWLSFLWYFCVHLQLEMGIVGRSAIQSFDNLHRPAAGSPALRDSSLCSPALGDGTPVHHCLKSASSPPPICCFAPCARCAPPRALHRALALFPLRACVFWRGARLHLRRGAPVRACAGLGVHLARRRARARRLRVFSYVPALTRSMCDCYARRRRRDGRHSDRSSRRARCCRCSFGHCSCAKQGQVRAGLEEKTCCCCRCCCCCSCAVITCAAPTHKKGAAYFSHASGGGAAGAELLVGRFVTARPAVCCCCCCSCCGRLAPAATLAKTRAFSCGTIPSRRCWVSCCSAFKLAFGYGASQKEAVGRFF